MPDKIVRLIVLQIGRLDSANDEQFHLRLAGSVSKAKLNFLEFGFEMEMT